MSLALTIIHASRARSTHHKLALDALTLLQGPEAEAWRDLFLAKHEAYLKGAKAPDTDFKDFANHVYHVSDNGWGGAPAAARRWKDRAIEAFAAKDWTQAVYAAGVMSHYYVDPIQPFHTGQSESEGAMHRPFEWSICKSYDTLVGILENELGGYPAMTASGGDAWLEDMIKTGAASAHQHYDVCIDHYNMELGRKNPPEGLDQEIKDRIARLIGLATAGLAAVLDKIFVEAVVSAPQVNATPAAILAGLDMPRQWVLKKVSDIGERAAIEAMYRELENTGRVVNRLPEDDAAIRNLHAIEVLNIQPEQLLNQPARRPGRLHGVGAAPRRRDPITGNVDIGRSRLDPTYPRARSTEALNAAVAAPAQPARETAARARPARETTPAEPRFYLSGDSPVVDAPSIGPKTADRLAEINVQTVSDLWALDPVAASEQLGVRYITPGLITEWQDQARLVACVPELRGHDAQILTGCGISSAEALAAASLDALGASTMDFCTTPQGKRVLRDSEPPDREEIAGWIANAQHARTLAAA